MMQHVYILGAKSIGLYGGFETFILQLLKHHQGRKDIKYHIACKANGYGCMDVEQLPGAVRVNDDEFTYCNAHCFLLRVPGKLGSGQAILYDIKALKKVCTHIERNHIKNPIVYILASRIGLFERPYVKRIHDAGGYVFHNPNGQEHKRGKYSLPVRMYWKISERFAVKNADLVVCDNGHIRDYIKKEYRQFRPKTAYIAYGADIHSSVLSDDDPKYVRWLEEHDLEDGNYYISVGRFVPENNYMIMIREFMKSHTDKDFAMITTDNPKYEAELKKGSIFPEIAGSNLQEQYMILNSSLRSGQMPTAIFMVMRSGAQIPLSWKPWAIRD